MVNLTIHLKETKLWWSHEWGGVYGAAGFIQEDLSEPEPQQPDGINPEFGPGGLSN
jgi:hypothetical protein